MTYEEDVASLTIAEVFPEDEGDYICRAFNEAGIATSRCDVIVRGI